MLHDLLSVMLLTAVVAAPVALVIRGVMSSPYTPTQTLLYFADVVLTRVLWRTHVPAAIPLAPGQGGVLVCNHRSSVDPFFIQLVAGRPVHWMVAREYCEHPALAWFLGTCEVIPVSRSGVDTASTRTAIRLARAGGAIGMFPEGRINMTHEFMLPCRPGAAMIALHAGVPLVPCYIEGSPYDRVPWSPLLMPAKVTVRFAKPIEVTAIEPADDHELHDRSVELMQRCVREIARLAGRNNVAMRLAGRDWKPSEAELAAIARGAPVVGDSSTAS